MYNSCKKIQPYSTLMIDCHIKKGKADNL